MLDNAPLHAATKLVEELEEWIHVLVSADPATLMQVINKNTGSLRSVCLAAMLKAFDDAFTRQAHQNIKLSERNIILNTRVRQKIVLINVLKDVLKSTPASAPMLQDPIHSHRISTDSDKFDRGESDVAKRQQSYVYRKTQLRVCFVQDYSVFNNERIKLLHVFGLLGGDADQNNRLYFE
ncbi:hypothetical protein K3495_g7333 [Podosphaera aphanis]|nr:hypothetical protein K3495_g7333 [Podosphaera aphanis]